ncbi:hypothetical protein [Leptolyngbya sp. FACHB-671]|nr:hypothetical protein [Leptolyngbya sp. FACHB-671]
MRWQATTPIVTPNVAYQKGDRQNEIADVTIAVLTQLFRMG